MSILFVVLVGIAGGLAASIQSGALAEMERSVGTLAGTFITYGIGGLVVGLAMLIFGRARFEGLGSMPWWAYSAGIMGLVIVSSLGITTSRFGIATGMTLFTAATLTFGVVIDQSGLMGEVRSVDIPKVIGLALVIVGTWLTVSTSS
jgi:bacterial/archaeal transporter family-2 protein